MADQQAWRAAHARLACMHKMPGVPAETACVVALRAGVLGPGRVKPLLDTGVKHPATWQHAWLCAVTRCCRQHSRSWCAVSDRRHTQTSASLLICRSSLHVLQCMLYCKCAEAVPAVPAMPAVTCQMCQEAEEAVEELRSQDAATRQQINTGTATLQVHRLGAFTEVPRAGAPRECFRLCLVY